MQNIEEEKEELQLELNALYQQFETLKNVVEQYKEKYYAQVQCTEQVQQKAEDLQAAFTSYQDEVGLFKQHLAKGMRDAKELENRYCEAVTEKVDLLKAMQQLQREFDKQQHELIHTKEKLKADVEHATLESFEQEQQLFNSNQRCEALELQLIAVQDESGKLLEKLDHLILKNDHLEQEKKALHLEKESLEKHVAENSLQVQRLEKVIHEKGVLEIQHGQIIEEISLQRALNEEKDFQLEEARQHFAKKMREVAQMNDAIEDLVRQIEEKEVVQKHLEDANRLLECDMQRGEEEKVELSERITALETEIKRWERDWLLENKQRLLAEEKNVELGKIEQCHAQLQSLLSNFGGSPKVEVKSTLAPLQFGVPPVQESFHDYETTVKPYSNLFDLPQVQPRSKQTLFD